MSSYSYYESFQLPDLKLLFSGMAVHQMAALHFSCFYRFRNFSITRYSLIFQPPYFLI
ncbi:hypothetical protein [Cecembia rubra]|uniref:hypothetical protein n=1 Tax=Cecembia rubra TaxID=1485585 RepID=UPI0027145375|nr:hypothetical protein [Cecembia rubra]